LDLSVNEVLNPSAVLVGDVSGDGINDIITSWWLDRHIYAFTVTKEGARLNLTPVDGWPIELPMPGNPNPTLATVSRNAITLADVDNDNNLELIAVGRDFGSGFDSTGWDSNADDDRYFVYLFETPGKVSADLEWPVWRNNFGLTAEYQTPELPPEPPPPPPPPCENRAPAAPTLYRPADGAGDIADWVDLFWRPQTDWGVNCEQNSNSFSVYLDQNANPTTQIDGTLSEDELHLAPKDLKYASTYYWKVRADNGALSSTSSVWKFNTCVPESKFPGDVTCDCAVTLDDLIAIAKIYGSQRGDANFDPALDIYPPYFFGSKGDGKINLQDLVQVANKWNTRCSE
jgi:hypothetical protein